MKPHSAACGRLMKLIKQAEKGSLDRGEAAAACLSIGRAALKNQRSGVSPVTGMPYSYDDPRHQAALDSVIAALKCTGQLGKEDSKPVPAMPEDLRAQLDAMGYVLVKKPAGEEQGNGRQH